MIEGRLVMTAVRRFMLPVAVVVGLTLTFVVPAPSWVRFITAGLWGVAFCLFSWWLAMVTRTGQITKKSYDIARHFWVLCGFFCYGALYALRHDFPVPPYIWLTVAILVSLVIRLSITFPDDYEQIPTSVD